MSRIAYVNGRYLPHGGAEMHIEDRATQFSDGVYEVIAVLGGRLIDRALHHERLERSLGEMRIAAPMGRAALDAVLDEVVRRNRVAEGIVYLQIGRGRAPRNHAFPVGVRPSVVVTARRARPATAAALTEGVAVITVPDLRWRRRDIKSVSLLANVLAKQAAAEAGAYEAWQVDDRGLVTEGAQSNAWIVDTDGTILTRPESNDILSGITRRRLIGLARGSGLAVAERAFTPDHARRAREAFLTSTSSFVVPVIRIDDHPVANGKPGSTTERLRSLYLDFASRTAA
ncbi:MAG TPA: D-amino-acid transaminase [Alphaproteobacteria bacterium]